MVSFKRFLFVVIFVFQTVCVWSQENSSLRQKRIFINHDTVFFDTLSIDLESFEIEGVEKKRYEVLPLQSALIWRSDTFPKDSVSISYRVLQFNFNQVYQKKNPNIISYWFEDDPFGYVPQNEKYLEQNTDKIQTIGNISRGIGFGNRQDVVVNSNLNLRLNGQLQNKVNVLAAISDDNNPIQPEGNTQQIQDFDRVFIQFQFLEDSVGLVAGDFPMVTPKSSYFMKYNKKSRGLQFNYFDTTKKGQYEISGEGAVSRGRFSRNIFAGIEGNQGPYRLKGANGETFIIIISGTEQVYLDGELLTRGEQNDYTVNYNTGELTFMPRKLITQYSRIIVEFQYSDRNYGRSVFRLGGNYSQGKISLRTNYFSEQDNKNQPFQQDLDYEINGSSVRQLIADAGDAQYVYIPRFEETLERNFNQILYIRKDSLGDSIFVYANPADTGILYRVTFSYVGNGNGSYRQKISTTNGKVFEWVGNAIGDYDPVQILIPPKRLQMLTVGADYQLNSKSKLGVELAQSNNQINTFSRLDHENDLGYALKTFWKSEQLLTKDSAIPWKLNSTVSFEQTDKNFRYIERYRNVEFDRTWNKTLTNPTEGQQFYGEKIGLASFGISKGQKVFLNINQIWYNRGNQFGGFSQQYSSLIRYPKFELSGVVENVKSNLPSGSSKLKNDFERYQAEVLKRGKWVSTKLSHQIESSKFALNADSILASSFRFEHSKMSLFNGDSGKMVYNLNVGRRVDFVGNDGAFKENTEGRDVNFGLGYNAGNNAQFDLNTTYRQLFFLNDTGNLKPENTLQGRLEGRFNLLKKLITTNAYYQLGTGQEQRREYSYLEVGDGNGNYIWNDYDSNGVQSLTEFELASGYDAGRANFIRQFLPVQGFIKSYSSEFNQNVRVSPILVYRKTDKKWLKMVNRFSNTSSLKVQKKVTDNNGSDFFNPLVQNVADTSLLTSNSSIRSVFSFNQSSPVFGMDYQWFNTQNKTLLINGVDSRNSIENKLKIRYNIKRNYELSLEATTGLKSYTSQFLANRAFDYTLQAFKPKLGYQLQAKLRAEIYYQYFEAHNKRRYGGEATYNHDFTTELRYNLVNQGIVRTSFGLVNINYLGNDNSPVAYELLAGLKNGKNLKWGLQIERRFSNSIQILINYDGRRSLNNPIIHIGRVQARYLF
ncbi:MAG: hypothetical protein H6607_06495 [Flavobacteriales bacterium]|nr:hypothetical protein [Flavobacteriales bacterium]